MNKIVLLPNPNKDNGLKLTKRVAEALLNEGALIYASSALGNIADGVMKYDDFPRDAELIIVVGGDGSILDASVLALKYDIPLVGVNLGRVGYLSEVEPDNISLLSRLFVSDYQINEMMLLLAERVSSDGEKSAERLAVNDVIISHSNFLGIAEFNLENSRGEEVKYRADGIIISSPQGSTAYSLSAGGPIVSNSIDSLCATPICPHSFFNRSIIFSSEEILTVKNKGAEPLNISLDGRFFETLNQNESCVIKKADKRLKLLSFKDNNMFSTLFKKMRILEDIK